VRFNVGDCASGGVSSALAAPPHANIIASTNTNIRKPMHPPCLPHNAISQTQSPLKMFAEIRSPRLF
jgi:hypothetical protein